MTNLVASRATADPQEPPVPANRGLLWGIAAALAAVGAFAVATGNGTYALGALGFVVALLVSVTLHEAGHFLTARRFGMKATHFFVGFGPTLWSRRTGEVEWGVKAVPAGGFVKIVGMTQLEEVDPADEPRAFWRQPAPQRAVVLAAGSAVHFMLAVLLVVLASFSLGKAVEDSPALGALQDCVTATAAADCSAGGVPSPALAAGLQAGDRVLAVEGREIADSEAFIRAVRGAPGTPLDVTVERDGQRRDVTVTPVPVDRPSLDDPAVTERVGAIGVAMQRRFGTERLGPVAAVENSVDTLRLTVTGIVTTFTDKLGTITKVYGPDRDPEGFIGIVGAGRVSGEVLASDETFGFKVLNFLLLIAGLNFFVGVFNLLPLLPLDGGHLAVLAYEQARDRVKRLFGYTGELRRVDLTKLLPLTYAVVVLFAGFTVWLLGADIVNPIRIY